MLLTPALFFLKCCYGIDLGASIVRFHQSEHSISRIWTNESGALCKMYLYDFIDTDKVATHPKPVAVVLLNTKANSGSKVNSRCKI